MTKVSATLLLIIAALTLSNCHKCVENQLATYKFSTDELRINPYVGNEVFIFKSLSGDSLKLTVNSRSSTSLKRYQNYNASGSSSDCPGDYVTLESNITPITSSNNSWSFLVRLFMEYSFSNNTALKLISTEVTYLPGQQNYSISTGTSRFETDTLFCYETSGSPVFHNTLTLGPKTFQNVYEVALVTQVIKNERYATYLYYSVAEGIVGFATYPSEIWYLDKRNK